MVASPLVVENHPMRTRAFLKRVDSAALAARRGDAALTGVSAFNRHSPDSQRIRDQDRSFERYQMRQAITVEARASMLVAQPGFRVSSDRVPKVGFPPRACENALT